MASLNNVIAAEKDGINPHLTAPYSSQLGIRIIEADLKQNVAKIGDMKPYTLVNYGKQEWQSKTATRLGMCPKWTKAYHTFKLTTAQTIDIFVLHKTMWFTDTEIGRAQLYIREIAKGHTTEWWPLFADGKEAGSILITFEFLSEGERRNTEMSIMALFSTHSSNTSMEQELEALAQQRRADQPPPQPPRLRPSIRAHTDESWEKLPAIDYESLGAIEIEQLRANLTNENNKIKARESRVKKSFERLKLESMRIEAEHTELHQRATTLHRREASYRIEKQNLENERKKLQTDQEKFAYIKSQINHDWTRLQQARTKLQSGSSILSQKRTEVQQLARDIEKTRYALKHGWQQDEDDSEVRLSTEWQEILQIKRTLADKDRILDQRIQSYQLEQEKAVMSHMHRPTSSSTPDKHPKHSQNSSQVTVIPMSMTEDVVCVTPNERDNV